MRRRDRSKLSPWIESLILSYVHQRPDEEGEAGGASGSSTPLRAHVIGVDELTPSQVQCSDGGPTGLLFLTDGALRIPAVLTASCWEHLQELEERETFSGLVHANVNITDYRMRFYMNPELNKCRFFMSVGGLGTISVGVLKEITHCCTTLSSVRGKMAETWRALLELEDSQRSQDCLDLSELLGEWYGECLQAVLEDIRSRLTAPQPSTSTHSSSLTSSSSLPATRWDVDRVRWKGERPFSVPVKCLLMPEEANPPPPLPPPPPPPPPLHPATEGQSSPLLVEDSDLHQHQDVLAKLTERPLSNPWDIFPPPCISSSSSPETTPPPPPPPPVESKPEPASSFFTSTQLPIDASKETSTFLPPYQNPPSSLDTTSSSSSTSTPRTQHSAPREQRDAKRKRSDAEQEEEEEEEEVSRDPPTWILNSGTSGSEVGSSPERPPVQRETVSAHGDGAPFSYSYRASGQNLQDFSRFRVTESLLRWAIKYLVGPGPTENPPNVV